MWIYHRIYITLFNIATASIKHGYWTYLSYNEKMCPLPIFAEDAMALDISLHGLFRKPVQYNGILRQARGT